MTEKTFTPAIDRTYPRIGTASTVGALIALREALAQWGMKDAAATLTGSLDKRPLPVTLRAETQEERAARPSHFPRPDDIGRLVIHHGPGDVCDLAGPLDLRPMVEELAAFEAFQRSKLWEGRPGYLAGDRVVRVTAEYRGRECGAEHVITERDLARWHGKESRLVQYVLEIVDQRIDGLVMRRVAGPELVAMLEGER